MINKILKIFAAASILMMTTGCSTVFLGFSKKVKIESEPSNAEIYDDKNRKIGTTPCEVKLSRQCKYIVFKKNGYRNDRMSTNRYFSLFPFALDAFCWPTFAVDIILQTHYQLDDYYFTELDPK